MWIFQIKKKIQQAFQKTLNIDLIGINSMKYIELYIYIHCTVVFTEPR